MPFDLRNELLTNKEERELPEGHDVRFASKLDRKLHLEKNIWRFHHMAIAASVIAFLGISLLIYTSFGHFNSGNMLIANYSPELQETENYLRSEIDTKLNLLAASDEINQDIYDDIQDIDKSFSQIKSDLQKNPGDERLIRAVIETYRIKLEILDEIISKVQ